VDKHLNILIVEDNEDDSLILVLHLEKENYSVNSARVETLEELAEKLESESWDLLISDYSLPGLNGKEVFLEFKKHNQDIPFILVSGAVGDETAAELMKMGVNDFFLKGKLQRLIPAIERELGEVATRKNNRQYEEQLKQAKIIIDNSPVILWEAVLEPEFEVVFCSDNVVQYGYQPDEFKSFRDMFESILHPDDKQALYEDMERNLRQNINSFSREYRLITKSGSAKWINTLFQRIPDQNSKTAHLQGININVTERKQFEEEIIAAKEKAEESDRFKSMLIANMNHELNTPLNGILGFAQVLKQSLSGEDEIEMSDSILTSAQRLQMTLDSVMIMGRLESGLKLNDTDLYMVNLSREVEKLGAYYGKKFEQKGLQYVQQIEPDMLVRANNKLLNMAIGNVIDNAFKFTTKGAVSIHLKVKMNSDSPLAELVVTDTGIGIPPETQGLIFDAFRQASEGYNRNYDGLGLGLSIAHRIILLMKGTISVNSIPGNGSDFIITFPLLRENDIK
jgi:PAS domain S-box-containing protein